MRIAEIVDVYGAGIVCALDVRREYRVQRPLLEHKFGNSQVNRLGIIVDDIAVLCRLREHQLLYKVPGDAVERQVTQLAAEAAFGEFVIDQFADQGCVHRADFACNNRVFHRFRNAHRDFRGELGLFHDLLDDPVPVPRQRHVLRC